MHMVRKRILDVNEEIDSDSAFECDLKYLATFEFGVLS